VEVTIEPGLLGFGDRDLLKAALGQLFDNAWKFTAPRDPARIEFGAGAKGGMREFFVRDNGVGFDMAYAARLFGAFQRMHAEDEFQGAGIGLAIVQRVVRRHGGHAWAEATPDGGATFYFTLPTRAGGGAGITRG
jgi:light-regulated signal transduction histidine kinase (bacteriophytochrome)